MTRNVEFDQGICDEGERREGRDFMMEVARLHFGIGICFDVIHTSTRKISWKNVEEVIIL